MATPDSVATDFPEGWLNTLDELLVADPVTEPFIARKVELIKNRTVQIPKVSFELDKMANYDRFKSDIGASIDWYPLTLEQDKEIVLYVDAVEIDDVRIQAMKLFTEFMRTVAFPEMGAYFFSKALELAGTKITTAPTSSNIKAQIATATNLFAQVGIYPKDVLLYMNAASHELLNEAVDRTYSNESGISNIVTNYNGFDIRDAPDNILGSIRYAFILREGAINDVRKRDVLYAFAPGAHTNGDGWLIQSRLFYDTIGYENKAVGLYVNAPASTPPSP